jgi:flavin reductase (DIM6/NTAB) family NADH-FMN oxidoreductase RutF
VTALGVSLQAIEGGDDFREVMSRFPTGVTVVTVAEDRFGLAGFTASSFVPLSLSPPLVLVCPQYGSRTYRLLKAADRFSIHILGEAQAALAKHFAVVGGDRTADECWHIDQNGYPVIEEALAVIQCRSYREYEGGDHAIVVGEVERTWITSQEMHPLLYYRGSLLPFPAQSVG